jgi:hypothetical protein
LARSTRPALSVTLSSARRIVFVAFVETVTVSLPGDLRREVCAPSRAQDAKTKEQTTSKGPTYIWRRFAPAQPAFVVRNLMKAMQ